MKTVIIATDFSSVALNATNFAVNMAAHIDASILLLHAFQLPVAINDEPPVIVSPEELQAVAETKLNDLKKDLEHVAPDKVQVQALAQLGSVSDVLEKVCERIEPFAVVMGATGHSSLDRMLFGSTILSVIKHLTWPVIGVPQGKDYGHGIKRAGLAIDFGEASETLPLAVVRNFAMALRAHLYAVNIGTSGEINTSVFLETAFSDVPFQLFEDKAKDMEGTMNAFVEKNNLDLLVSIQRSHGWLEGLFRRDPTRAILSHSSVPVMFIHN